MQLKISSSDDTFQYFIITIMCTAGISKNYSSRSWSYVTVWMTNWLLSEESVLLSKFYILLYIRTPWLFDLQIIMSWGPIKMRNQRAKFFINNMLFSSCLCFFYMNHYNLFCWCPENPLASFLSKIMICLVKISNHWLNLLFCSIKETV